MSWIKKRINDYVLDLLGSKAIFDQEQTLEIKKKNDYYEEKLNLPEMLSQLSTPAPVVGDITTMTDPMPGVRLPRIPYYEYIYYLMRWNSSVLRMIGFKLKQEIFRETRLQGLDWEGKFKTKCDDCGTEFDIKLEECEYCKSKNVSPPDPTQKKLLEPFVLQSNKAEQTLLEVCEEIEDDLNTVDDSYLIFVKDYFVGPGGLFGQVKEIMRGDTSRFRIVSDISGRRGGKWWVCPAHRGNALKQVDYSAAQVCDICGLPLQEVHYVETTAGGVTPNKYYIAGEVVHASKYEPSRLYGIPPIFSVYIVARTIQLMDLYTEEYYEKGRLKGVLAVPSENTTELRKWWDEIMIRMRNDPHYVPIVGMGSDINKNRGRMEFVKLVDNMSDLRFHEHRKLLKEEIAGLFGVNLIFLADSSTGGGLNNEGLQITVTDRTIEWGQSVYHDQFFPKILEFLNITDWRLKLKPSKETDEMAELERFDLRVETATKLQNMGYGLELRDDKFEVTGKAFIVDKPDPMGAFGGQGSLPQQGGGNPKLLPAATQEGKPDKPKPEKEIKRSLEIEKVSDDDLIWSLYRAWKAVGGSLEKIDNVISRLGYTGMGKDQLRKYLLKLEQKRIIELQTASDPKLIQNAKYGFFLWSSGKIQDLTPNKQFPTGYKGRGFLQYMAFRKKIDAPERFQKSDMEKGRLPSHLRGKSRDQLHNLTIDQFTRVVFEAADYGDIQELNRIKGILGKERTGTFNNHATKKHQLEAAFKIYREETVGGKDPFNWNKQYVNIPKHLEDLEDRFKRCLSVANPTGHQKHFCNAIIEALKMAISRKQNQLVGRFGQGQYRKMPSDKQKEYDRLRKLYDQAKKYQRNNLKKSADYSEAQEWLEAKENGTIGKIFAKYPTVSALKKKARKLGYFKDSDNYLRKREEVEKKIISRIAGRRALFDLGKSADLLSDDFLGELTVEEIKKGLLPMSIIRKICSYLSFTKAEQEVDPKCLASELSTIAAKNPGWSKNKILLEAVSRCGSNESNKSCDDDLDKSGDMLAHYACIGNKIKKAGFKDYPKRGKAFKDWWDNEKRTNPQAREINEACNKAGNIGEYDEDYPDPFTKALGKPEYFDLIRNEDESGTSGTGHVGSGIIFPDGQVVFRWATDTSSTVIYSSLKDFNAIHVDPHPGNDTEFYWYELELRGEEVEKILKSISLQDDLTGNVKDFAKAVVERGKDVLTEYKQIEHNFAKQLEEIYNKKLAKKIAKLDDKSSKKLIKEIEDIVNEASPIIEKLAFSEVLRAYKKGKKIDESRDVTKTISLPENLTEPFRAEYGAFGINKDDWQVLRAIYRENPFWKAFTGMSQSVSDKLKEHITESYEAPNSAKMKATIRDVKNQYPDIGNERAESIAYGRIGKFSIAKILTMMKRTINAETYRLERIARTETTAVTSKGREMAFKTTDPEGLHKYDWFGPNDNRNSDECPEIKRRIRAEGKGKGVTLERVKEIQEEVVADANKMRKSQWNYRDWVPHANCRHGLRRIV